MATTATPDHLVVAATTLAEGIDYVSTLTGTVPHPGGRHIGMGTHNALIRLGERLYLEIIAIDPDSARPTRKRWFDLDNIALQAELLEHPRLVHWVARTHDIATAVQACPAALGTVHAFDRGDYRWRISVPDDGSRPGKGLVPAIMQWDVPMHPADALSPSSVSLVELAGSHPDPASIREALRRLGLSDALRVNFDRETRLVAMLRTPRGLVTLSS